MAALRELTTNLDEPRSQEQDVLRLRETALFFVARGIPVVPLAYPIWDQEKGQLRCMCAKHKVCQRQAKHPESKVALTHVSQVERKWAEHPYNIGLICQDINVLDHDDHADSLRLAAAVPGLWYSSLFNVSTPRGGVHQYFAATTDLSRARIALPGLTDVELLEAASQSRHHTARKTPSHDRSDHPGQFDWQAGGQLIIAPGSRGINGKYYEVTRDVVDWSEPDMSHALTFAPEPVLRTIALPTPAPRRDHRPIRGHVRNADQRAAAFLAKISESVAQTPPGARNAELNKQSFHLFLRVLRTGDLKAEDVRDEMARAASMAGLALDEIESTLDSAWAGAVRKMHTQPRRGDLE